MQSLIPQWLITNVCSSPKHTDHVYPKNILDNSMLQSYRTILAEPFGDNLADYAIPLTNGSRLHIKEYSTIYKIHWDVVDPYKSYWSSNKRCISLVLCIICRFSTLLVEKIDFNYIIIGSVNSNLSEFS